MKTTITLLSVAAFAGTASAANVTPDVIFGSGNANGAFTVAQSGGVELGLRGKLRFNDSNSPENTFKYDGVNTYQFKAGAAPGGFGFDPNNPSTPIWNFEWSVNTDFDGSSGLDLDDLTYALSLDSDPGAGVTSVPFDMINVAASDHALGTNATGNGNGTSSVANYAANLTSGNFNVAQNSWNYEFFNDMSTGLGLENFDPNVQGTYTITLSAFNSAGLVTSTSININVVPMPTPLGMAGLGLMGVAGLRRRR